MGRGGRSHRDKAGVGFFRLQKGFRAWAGEWVTPSMNRLSFNQIRANAAQFAKEWEDAQYERGETQSFYNAFFEVFGVKRRKVASFEEPVKKLGGRQGFIDLFWKGVLLVEHKSAGRKLAPAKTQALDYFPGIKDSELPRYLLLSDFQTFELHDLEEGESVAFPLAELPDHVEKFGFILGIEKRTFRDQDPVNIAASELMGKLHDALLASGYKGKDLERLLVRLLFCLFADDTGIFEPIGLFTDLIAQRTQDDGSDVGLWLAQLFDVLNEPPHERQATLDEDLNAFPYVNGDLFAERLRVPSFTKEMRARLLEACDFNWDAISPAIFGALFQSVMKSGERRAQGAHYTTERNILKVIEPLFLQDLQAEFQRLKERRDTGRRAALEAFQDRLASLRFFDPACGCGNFLVLAYRELRALELQVLRELYPLEQRQQVLDIEHLIRVNVGQFYGLEIGEFPARIAEVALWMTDHIANNRVSLEFGQVFRRIPLRVSPHIRHADALETNWDSVLPAADCDYLLGNPPFVGAKYQSEPQRAQVRRIAQLGGSGGTLDYVAAWFLTGGAYARAGKARIGFVSTNSVTQGEQVAQLWPLLLDRCGLELAFAHSTFAWGSDARGMAHVHVVILGLTRREDEPRVKRLFAYDDLKGNPTESGHAKLSPYLIDAANLADPHLVVREASQPINGLPPLVIGSKPIDGGHLIFTEAEREAFLELEPGAAPFLRPYVGAEELINGSIRFILALQEASPAQLSRLPHIKERMERVRQYREQSISPPTRALAAMPTRYHVNVLPVRPFLVIPEVSSERREYAPLAYLEPPTIPSSLVRVLPDASLWLFGLLTSRMNMAWLRTVGGKLESRYRYSIGIVYNTFPLPALADADKARLDALAQKALDARAAFPDSTLADLYDRLTMPPALRKAHQALDNAVDKLYRPESFADDRERAEHLLGRYESLSAPLLAVAQAKPKRRKNPPRLT